MASTVWKGYVSFGLVTVPIRLYVAARDEHISFNQVHEVCGTRIKQQLFCPHCERVVERKELVKGYPLDKERNLIFKEEELKALAPESSSTMEIVQFVDLEDIDPIYYETSYYSVPEEAGRRPYALLLQTMKESKLAAIAKVTLHSRERIVVLRPYGNGLALHTIYYPNEVRAVAEYGQPTEVKLQEQEVKLAEQFAEALKKPFHPEQFKDEYEARVLELIESRAEGHAEPSATPQRKLAPVIDLMDALKKSLDQREKVAAGAEEKKPPQRAVAAKKRKAG
ncbi:MAG TPA: Ku protein [Acidobacteriaceae bacterium]|jgi:DNA end-binding protein Ku|nr:Ku protein [Acidobacteriaceae bacterium]